MNSGGSWFPFCGVLLRQEVTESKLCFSAQVRLTLLPPTHTHTHTLKWSQPSEEDDENVRDAESV